MKPRPLALALLLCLDVLAYRPVASCADAPSARAPAAEGAVSPSRRTLRLDRLAQGSMAKLRVADKQPLLPDVALTTADGGTRRLSDLRGRTLILHFWASWCAPCQTEIPEIARLEARLHDDTFALLAVSLDKSPAETQRFLASLGVASLPLARDPDGTSAAALGARGLPTSILIDPEGREIGRIEGSADWMSDDAILLLMAVLEDARAGASQSTGTRDGN